MSAKTFDPRPLVVHVVYRFDVGGLENGVVNLINHMPSTRFRHAIVSLTDASEAFSSRLHRRADVAIEALHKPPGHGSKVYGALHKLLRQWQPSVVHTRNLAALEMAPVAWAAGVPARVHGEHGRDSSDPDGTVARYRWIRRLYQPFVNHQIALSGDLADYLRHGVGVPTRKITQILNGVDAMRFAPLALGKRPWQQRAESGCPFSESRHFVVGTVGRMQTVKNQPLLAKAFVRALVSRPDLHNRLRLACIGDGPLREVVFKTLQDAGVEALAWLPGELHDVPEQMRCLDAFVLPSQAEGISNTILEAMATGLPVVATRVGGNAELVADGVTGRLVASDDVDALASHLVALADDDTMVRRLGEAGRARVEERFSLQAMVDAYVHVYNKVLHRQPDAMLRRATGSP